MHRRRLVALALNHVLLVLRHIRARARSGTCAATRLAVLGRCCCRLLLHPFLLRQLVVQASSVAARLHGLVAPRLLPWAPALLPIVCDFSTTAAAAPTGGTGCSGCSRRSLAFSAVPVTSLHFLLALLALLFLFLFLALVLVLFFLLGLALCVWLRLQRVDGFFKGYQRLLCIVDRLQPLHPVDLSGGGGSVSGHAAATRSPCGGHPPKRTGAQGGGPRWSPWPPAVGPRRAPA